MKFNLENINKYSLISVLAYVFYYILITLLVLVPDNMWAGLIQGNLFLCLSILGMLIILVVDVLVGISLYQDFKGKSMHKVIYPLKILILLTALYQTYFYLHTVFQIFA